MSTHLSPYFPQGARGCFLARGGGRAEKGAFRRAYGYDAAQMGP
jgi:hypothetical protein